MDESTRLNCNILNNGFINGIQAVMILKFTDALYDGKLELGLTSSEDIILSPYCRINVKP